METILAENPQAVVVATGSTPYLPEIPGVEGSNVLSVADVLNGAETGERVVIVDTQGTPPACLLADYLADQGKQVEIVTGLTVVGSGIPARAVWHHLYGRLVGKGVTMSPMTGVTRIMEDSVEVYHVVSPEMTWTIQGVDTVVIAGGGQANDGLYKRLKGESRRASCSGGLRPAPGHRNGNLRSPQSSCGHLIAPGPARGPSP